MSLPVSHATIMAELAAALESLKPDVVKTINIWDDVELSARLKPQYAPALVLWEQGDYTEPGPETDSLWRYYVVKVAIFGAYTVKPETKSDPDEAKTVFAISQQVRKRIAQIPRLTIDGEAVELARWLQASGGFYTPAPEDGPSYVYRTLPVAWRVWEEWDGGGTPVESIFTAVNG